MIKEFYYSTLNGRRFFNAHVRFLLLIFTALAFTAPAQNIKVTDTVRDQNGDGLRERQS